MPAVDSTVVDRPEPRTMKSNRSTANDPPEEGGESTYHVLGGGHLGTAVVRRLRADGRAVTLVDDAHDPSEPPEVRGDPASLRTLAEAGVTAASTVVVATRSDRRNLLIAQLVRTHFDVSGVVALVNAPDRLPLFTEAGHDAVCATSALSDALVDSV